MADIKGFIVAMERRGKEFEDGAVRVVQQAVIATGTALILSTPVVTGYARGNWQTSKDVPASGEIDRFDPSGAGAIADMVGSLAGLKAGQAVYLTNNIPYIEKLNDGSSDQQAAGWVERALAAGSTMAELEGRKIFTR